MLDGQGYKTETFMHKEVWVGKTYNEVKVSEVDFSSLKNHSRYTYDGMLYIFCATERIFSSRLGTVHFRMMYIWIREYELGRF